MVEQSDIELMDYVLVNEKWYVGYCNTSTARTIRHRHNKRILSEEIYDKVFIFKGFKKNKIWTRN